MKSFNLTASAGHFFVKYMRRGVNPKMFNTWSKLSLNFDTGCLIMSRFTEWLEQNTWSGIMYIALLYFLSYIEQVLL